MPGFNRYGSGLRYGSSATYGGYVFTDVQGTATGFGAAQAALLTDVGVASSALGAGAADGTVVVLDPSGAPKDQVQDAGVVTARGFGAALGDGTVLVEFLDAVARGVGAAVGMGDHAPSAVATGFGSADVDAQGTILLPVDVTGLGVGGAGAEAPVEYVLGPHEAAGSGAAQATVTVAQVSAPPAPPSLKLGGDSPVTWALRWWFRNRTGRSWWQ